ncbi:zinc-binding dehydrogenase [Nocardioides bruguierae]|uniref:zinc-binding dehydrogenase n=1 Tax=Nocardioides bruguierae TaxID=2945102 RepID=UPI0020207BE7|nr:zinc-binding dehydrogenase [Nocardioides bruguierae]MCL8025970.1 zinc-binding dehydrogenase [Nocardioides bruguierae]
MPATPDQSARVVRPPAPGATMLAMVTTAHGGPEVVEARRVPVPVPGPGEVLVRVAAAGCNNTDLWTREGAYGPADDPSRRGGWLGPLDFPRIQGGDVAGTVFAHGEGVTSPPLGARVLVDPALYDSEEPDALVVDVLGSERDGGFAEHAVVPASCVHDVTGSPLTDVELAALPIAYGTALGLLARSGAGEGDTVLVTGASGGVGLAAVELASARGCRVVAVSSGAKADAVRAAGADVVVDRGRGTVLDDVRAACPEGLDAALDVVAGPVLSGGLGLLRPGGRWVVAGSLDGAQVSVDVRSLYLANQALVGSTMHSPAIFAELVDLARAGEVRPVIAVTHALADLPAAHADLAGRGLVGKVVVVP